MQICFFVVLSVDFYIIIMYNYARSIMRWYFEIKSSQATEENSNESVGDKSNIIELDDLIQYTKECFIISSGDHCKLREYITSENEEKIKEIPQEIKDEFDYMNKFLNKEVIKKYGFGGIIGCDIRWHRHSECSGAIPHCEEICRKRKS